MTTDTRFVYLTCAETAVLVRRALKTAFPMTRFSVRSKVYAGGASVDVTWTDGPTWRSVQDICDRYESAQFDPAADLETSVSHWLLPDGTVRVRSTPGTEGSRGIEPSQSTDRPSAARPVQLGAKYVQAQRRYSAPFLRWVAIAVAAEYRLEPPIVHEGVYGAWIDQSGPSLTGDGCGTLGHLIVQRCAITAAPDHPLASAS